MPASLYMRTWVALVSFGLHSGGRCGQLNSEEDIMLRKVTGGGQRSLRVVRQGLTYISAEMLN